MAKKCPTCGKKAHDFEKEEALDCVPPKGVLKFGKYQIDKKYRDALYKAFPMYTSEEVVGSYLGHNPNFPSQDEWHNPNSAEGSTDDDEDDDLCADEDNFWDEDDY